MDTTSTTPTLNISISENRCARPTSQEFEKMLSNGAEIVATTTPQVVIVEFWTTSETKAKKWAMEHNLRLENGRVFWADWIVGCKVTLSRGMAGLVQRGQYYISFPVFVASK